MSTYFNLNDISRYRSALMGASILIIMLFHCALLPYGHIGVEFFLCISAIGLFFSLSRNPDTIQFYKKRLIRILPAYFVLTIPYALVFGYYHPEAQIKDLLSMLFQIRTLTETMNFSQWFISLILICYLFTPLFFKYPKVLLSYPFLICFTIFCFTCSRYFPCPYIIERLPVFFWSLKFASHVYRKEKLHCWKVGVQMACFLAFWITIQHLTLKYSVHASSVIIAFLLATIPAVILMTTVLSFLPQKLIGVLNFFGSISLELYLCHECIRFVLGNIFIADKVWSETEFLAIAFASIALATLTAYLTHKAVAYATEGLTQKLSSSARSGKSVK